MARPCDENKYCSYKEYDYTYGCTVCSIDYDGENCPYIKPWGKKKYEEEQRRHEIYGSRF